MHFIIIDTSKSSRILINNNFDPMKVGEVRKFEIDVKEKPKCTLPAKDNIIEIKIKKLQENENDYHV